MGCKFPWHSKKFFGFFGRSVSLLLSPSTIYEDGGGYGGYGMGYSNMNNFPELRGYSARRRYSRDCEWNLTFLQICDEEWVLTWILHLWPEDYPNYGCKMILLWSIMNHCARSSASQMLTLAFHLFLSFLDGGSGGYGGYGGYGRGYY
jgi:hypothetical protein